MPFRPVSSLLLAVSASVAFVLSSIAPAVAADDASIGGHVYDAGTTAPLPGAIVELYPFDQPPYDAASETVVATATTDADGGYVFSGLARSAMYQLRFARADDPTDFEWYPNAGDRPSAGFAYAIDSTDFDASLGDAVTFTWQATGRPRIAGTPTVGSTLTADPGTWTPTPDALDYQWIVDGGPVSGATGATFTIEEELFGSVIAVEVTAHKAAYPTTKARSAVIQVITFDGMLEAMDADDVTTISGRFDSRGVAIASVPIAGFPSDGSDYVVLSTGTATEALGTVLPGMHRSVSTSLENAPAGVGGWDMTTVTLSVDPADASTCLAIDYAFATKESAGTYTKDALTIESPRSKLSMADDHEHVIAPNNRAFDTGGQMLNPDSPDLAAIEGSVMDRWSPKLTVLIPLASDATDVIVSVQDIGDEAADSIVLLDNLRPVDDPVCASGEQPQARYVTMSGFMTYSGEAVVGKYLTVQPGQWNPAPVILNYQWMRGSTPIPGATSPTYRVAADDIGNTLAARVTGSKDGYVPLTRTGPPTEPVDSGEPSIAGVPVVDAVLTGDPGRFSPGGRLNYRWLRGGKPIHGAVGTSYRVGAADLGARITFRVTTIDVTPVDKRTSAPTAPVALARFDVVPVPTVTGSRIVGAVVTAHVGTWTPSTQSVIYQWRRDGMAIPGAVSRRYTLQTADEGSRIDVKIIGLRLGYRAGAADSLDGAPISPRQ